MKYVLDRIMDFLEIRVWGVLFFYKRIILRRLRELLKFCENDKGIFYWVVWESVIIYCKKGYYNEEINFICGKIF